MKLRDYQSPQVNKLIRQLQNANEGALISAVGTGKTIVTAVVGDELIKRGIVKKVIVSAPFNTIVKEFPDLSGKKFLSGVANNAQYLIGKIDKSENIKHLIDVITGNSSEFISTSHHAMANHRVRTAVNQADDLSDLLLVIDEAHHCFTSDDEDENKDGTLLGEIADKIKQKGGKILYVTATPYRTVGNQTNLIFDPLKCNPVIRTIGEQMRDGYAPSLNTEYIHVRDVKLINGGIAGVFGDLLTTRISDPQLKTLLPRIVKQWKAEKYPKTIMLIPAGNADHTAQEVKKYLEEIIFPSNVAKIRGRKHPSVLISVGDSGSVIEFNGKEMSEIEYDKANNGHIYDIVIGCRKFDEGTDVSSASHIFMVGLPSSVRLFHQRTGRVLRDKKNIEDYAEWFGTEWVDKSKVVFFAPIGKKSKEFDYKVGRQLLHCIFSAESYQEYCESLNASQNIRIAFENKHKKAKTDATRAELEEWMALLGKLELNELKDYSSNEFNELVKESLNPDMTVGERIDMIKSSTMSDDERELALNNIINHLPNDIKDKIDWDAIVNSIMKSGKKKKVAGFDVPPTSAISDVFDDVLREFYSVKITTNTERAVQQVFSSLSGETFKEWAEKCSQFMGEDNAIYMCNQVIDFYKVNNRYPSTKSSDIIESKLATWTSNQKQAKLGKSCSKFYPIVLDMAINANLSDMFDFVDYEQVAIEQCKEFISFYTTTGRFPSQKSNNKTELLLGRWLSTQRQNKKDKNNRGIFYPILDKMCVDAGISDAFECVDYEQVAIEQCKEFISFYTTHNKLPSRKSMNMDERSLGNWLSDQRKAKLGKSDRVFNPELDVMASTHGLPDLFNIRNLEDESINMCKQVIEFYRQYNRYPTTGASDLNESKLAQWINHKKQKKQGKGYGTFYETMQRMVSDAGIPTIFDLVDRETESLNRCNEVIEFHKNNGKYPSHHSTDVYERTLGKWRMNQKSAKNSESGISKSGIVFYSSVALHASKLGYTDMFSIYDKESVAIECCNNVINFYNKHKKYPSTSSTDKTEKTLAMWLSNRRKNIMYNSLIELVVKHRLPNMFNVNWKDDIK